MFCLKRQRDFETSEPCQYEIKIALSATEKSKFKCDYFGANESFEMLFFNEQF